MRSKWKYFFLLSVIASCKNNADQTAEKDSSFYSEPLTVPLNLSGGYAVNSFTGDSIKPLVTLSGDTLKTGIRFPCTGFEDEKKKISSKMIKPKSTDSKIVLDNYYPLPSTVKSFLPDSSKITRTKLGEGDQSFVLRNSTGILPTGIPIEVTGKKVSLKEPIPARALPMRAKDNATVNVQYLDVEQGLGYSYVTALYEDKKGIIWIGTDGTGISKYDGINFITYTTNEGLPGNNIRQICEDKKGNIWISTENGIGIIDGATCIQFTEKQGMTGKFVLNITEDSKGNMWMGTDGDGLTKFTIKNLAEASAILTHYTIKEGVPYHIVSTAIEDKKGNIWFSTLNGLVRFDGNEFVKIETDVTVNSVTKILEDTKGNIWIGTVNGVIKYDGTSFTRFSEKEGLSDNVITKLLEDRKGNIWIGTVSGGVNKFDGKGFTLYTQKQGLSGKKISEIMEDKQGNIWLGFEGGGVNKLNTSGFSYKIDKQFFNNSRVRPITKDAHDNLWFGTETGGIYKYNGKGIKKYNFSISPNTEGFRSMLTGKDGMLWFGTTGEGALIRYDVKNFVRYTFGDKLSSTNIMSVIEDEKGDMWVGTYEAGVKRTSKENYNGKKSTYYQFTQKEGLTSNKVLSVFEDSKKNIWICTEGGGVSKYDGANLINYTEKEGLFCKTVTSVAEDKAGNIWLGTLGAGLCRFDGISFNYYTTQQGLSHNNVWSVFEDSIGHLWAGTDKGLSLLILQQDRVQKNKTNYAIYSFGFQDGIRAIDFNLHSFCIDKDDHIWWGTGAGVPTLDMYTQFNSYLPRSLSLNFMEINDRFIDFRNLDDRVKNRIIFDSVKPFCNYPDKLSLTHDQNHISFHFNAIDWAAPDKIMYSYRLLGLDEKWSAASHDAFADFRSLPHGNYILQIKARGQSLAWTSPINYPFTILPPWWLTWWFKLIVVIAALAFIFIIVRFIYNYQLRKQRTLMEKQLAIQMERQRISSEMHDDIGAGLSGVRLLTEMTKNKLKDNEVTSDIDKIYQSVGDVSAKMKEVIWSLNSENDSLINLIEYLHKQSRQLMEHYPCKFEIKMPEKIPDIKVSGGVRRQIYLSLKEALHNIIKHSGADKVELNISCDDKLSISVSDNGRGMNPDENYSGGNGLKNMRKRMKELNGEFFLKHGKGLTLTFEIPLQSNT